MPAARPSQAQIANVIAAMKSAGIEPGEIVVSKDGGFTVKPKPLDDSPKPVATMPRKWGQTG